MWISIFLFNLYNFPFYTWIPQLMCLEKWINESFASWNAPWIIVFIMFYKYSTQGMQWLICGIRTVLYRHLRDRSKCNLQGKPSPLQFLFHKSQRDRYWQRTSSALPFWKGLIKLRWGTLYVNAVLSTREKESHHTLPFRVSLPKPCWIISVGWFHSFSSPFFFFFISGLENE